MEIGYGQEENSATAYIGCGIWDLGFGERKLKELWLQEAGNSNLYFMAFFLLLSSDS